MVVPSLPEAATPDAEVCTNLALNVDATRLQTLTLSVAFDSCETNEVLVAIGADGDNDGDLSLDEAAIVFGCDCGEWYRTDLRTGTASTEGSDPSVEAIKRPKRTKVGRVGSDSVMRGSGGACFGEMRCDGEKDGSDPISTRRHFAERLDGTGKM